MKTPALLFRGGEMGLARGQVDCVMLASAGEGSPAPNSARPREFPFWLTRFPTSESYPAIAGRTLRTRLGWVAAEVELHGSLMPTPAVRLRWPFRSALGATANRRPLPQTAVSSEDHRCFGLGGTPVPVRGHYRIIPFP